MFKRSAPANLSFFQSFHPALEPSGLDTADTTDWRTQSHYNYSSQDIQKLPYFLLSLTLSADNSTQQRLQEF